MSRRDLASSAIGFRMTEVVFGLLLAVMAAPLVAAALWLRGHIRDLKRVTEYGRA